MIQDLKDDGISDKNIIYISFESLKYKDVADDKELDEIILNKIEGIEGKLYLLFDEIQSVKNWEKSINAYRVDLDCDIYITGSNSTLLSGELATVLSGRYISVPVYPFSYSELLKYYQKNNENLDFRTENKIFNEYLLYGGFPGLLKYDDDEKLDFLNDLYSSIVEKDIIGNIKLGNLALFKKLLKFTINNVGRIFSANSISKYLKHEGLRTTPQTIINYLNRAKESFVFFKVQREDLLDKKVLTTLEKYYLVDLGFYTLFVSQKNRNYGQILENLIFIELIRRGFKVTIGRLNNLEVDFVCKKPNKTVYVQVSQSIADSNTREREIKALEKINDNFDKYILSLDLQDYSYNGIIHMNIMDFLKLDDF